MKEKLSEFVDGELDAQACDPLVEALRSAPDMRRRWDAYCLIGDALRGDRVGAADFVSRRESLLHLAVPDRRQHGEELPRLTAKTCSDLDELRFDGRGDLR